MIKYILLPFLAACSLTFSQKKSDPTPEHIQQAKDLKTQFENDDIIILNSKEYIHFSFNKKDDKVKVTHQNNEELMNISNRTDIQKYVQYDGESNVSSFELKYRNKKPAYFQIIDEAISDDGMFHHDARVKFTNVDFPVQGYKYYFESVKETKDIKYFTSLYFTNTYRTLKKEIKVIIPKWLDIEFKEMNFEGYSITKKERIDPKTEARIITYTAENLNGIYDEKQAPGPSYIYPHLLVLTKSYENDGVKHNLFNETKDLYAWYNSLVKSMDEKPEELKEKVNELIKDAITDEEKIKNIYYWVQDNIRYIAFEDGIAGFKPDESQNVFKKRYGDCKGMANLTKQMLKQAGFDARLTWIGTKRIAYDYSTPSLSVDNHMICTLIKDGEKIFLDGTEKYNSFGEYAERIQGKQVLIENGDDFILAKVPVNPASKNEETFHFNAKIVNNELVGHVVKSFDGESRATFLYHFNATKNNRKEDALNYYLNNDDKNLSVSNIVTSNLHNRDNVLNINYDLAQKNAISSFDDDIYIDLDYYKEFGKFEFSNRNTDYLFSHKKNLSSVITLEIPDGYKITETPENLHTETENYKIDVSYNQKGNTLTYSKKIVLKNAILKTTDFNEWNDIVKKLHSIYEEQLVLTKKQLN
ncbi:MAG: transglutaminase-like domain-containing protein [Flavobacteriaceae bacterium]